jgi:hypothetical protein
MTKRTVMSTLLVAIFVFATSSCFTLIPSASSAELNIDAAASAVAEGLAIGDPAERYFASISSASDDGLLRKFVDDDLARRSADRPALRSAVFDGVTQAVLDSAVEAVVSDVLSTKGSVLFTSGEHRNNFKTFKKKIEARKRSHMSSRGLWTRRRDISIANRGETPAAI